MSQVPVRSKLSPSVTEQTIIRHFVRDPITREHVQDPVLTDLFNATKTIREHAEKSEKLANATLHNDMLTLPARHREARKLTDALMQPATRRLDTARANAVKALAELEAKTARPPKAKNVVEISELQEIRAALRKMEPKQRDAVIGAALAGGDDQLMAAVINGHAMLVGMTPTQLEMTRASWRQRRFPNELSQMLRYSAAVEDIDRIGGIVMPFVAGLVDHQIISNAEASEQAAREAAAAVNE
jgi:hypothetical protein